MSKKHKRIEVLFVLNKVEYIHRKPLQLAYIEKRLLIIFKQLTAVAVFDHC